MSAWQAKPPADGHNHGPLSRGAPIPVVVEIWRVLAHHGQVVISQTQSNKLAEALSFYDWAGYEEPGTPYRGAEEDEG